MRVKLVRSHPANTRSPIKMARVSGDTFFRKVETKRSNDDKEVQEISWRHVDNSCKNPDHWVWHVVLQVLSCVLARKRGKWEHKEAAMCQSVRNYTDAKTRLQEAQDELKANDATIQALKEKVEKKDSDAEAAETKLKDTERRNAELKKLIPELDAIQPPACAKVPADFYPTTIAGRLFQDFDPDGIYIEQPGQPRSKQKQYYQDFGGRKITVTRSPNPFLVSNFVKMANEKIGQALKLAPPVTGKHITVEV